MEAYHTGKNEFSKATVCPQDGVPNNTGTKVAIGVGAGLALLTVMVLIIFIVKKKNLCRRNSGYERLDSD